MFKRLRQKKAFSITEYVALLIFVIGAYIVFEKYIARGVQGHWRKVGESISFGRLYSPTNTRECIFDYIHNNVWYDLGLFEANNCDCWTVAQTPATCQLCILASQSVECSTP